MGSPPPYQFSVSEFTTMPWRFDEDVTHYAQLGVSAMEVCEIKLEQRRMSEQLSTIGEHGLAISSVQPVVRTLFPSLSQPEPKNIPNRMARFRETIASFGDYAAGVPFITNTGKPPQGNIQEVMVTAVREYRALADFASEYGARVALEPLNPSIMNLESSIWLLEQAMEIVAKVDRPNLGICLDYWNIFQNPRIEDGIKAAGPCIFIVQVSDWRTPRSDADRHVVGKGDIPFPPLLRATYESGYRGAYELEIFSDSVPDSLWKQDLDWVIKASWEGFEHAWQQAFSS